MKTAILLTGFVRTFSFLKHNTIRVLSNTFPNCDFFFCSWDVMDIKTPKKIDESLFRNSKEFKILSWIEHEKKIPKLVVNQRENDIFKVNKFAILKGINAANNIKNQWYLVNQGKDMIDSSYDYIVRCRFDLQLRSLSVPEIKPGVSIPFNFYTSHYKKNADIGPGFCDHFAYGDYSSMMKYLSLYENFDLMYHHHNANVAHAEGLLKYYLTEFCALDINMNDNILYEIVKSPFDVDTTPMEKYFYEDNIA